MANIEITDQGGGSLSNGVLQLENGVAMDTTLRYVADQANTKSQLLLATNATTVEGTLKVKTNNVEYIDVEDGSGNNRFTISRPALGQKVALDFASNPVGSTTPVGAIRTFQDGVNLSDAMTFIEDGSIGIGTTAPVGLLHMYKPAINVRLAIDGDAGFNRLISYRTGALPRWGLYADNTAESGSNAGTNFAIRRYNDAGTFIDAPLTINRANGRVSVNERLLVESDSTVTTQTSSVIQSSTTNANMVIAPNGTGSLVASIPDGAATGGNARGTNAVDLQTSRTANTQVASGANSAIVGGSGNTASGGTSLAVGLNNVASSESSIAIGRGNTAAGIRRNYAIGENNTVSGFDGSAALGQANNVSGIDSSIAIGRSNTISGTTSFGFGASNSVIGNEAYAVGKANSIGSLGSFAFGSGNNVNVTPANSNMVAIGFDHKVSGPFATSLGKRSWAYLYGQIAHASEWFTVLNDWGSAQQSTLLARREATLTTGATTILSLDGTGVTNLIIPLDTRSWNVKISYVAIVRSITGTATGITVGDTKSQNIEIGFKKVGGASSLVGAGSYSIAQEDASMNTATLTPSAGGSQQLALTFTAPTFAGGGSIICRVVAKVELVEVAWV